MDFIDKIRELAQQAPRIKQGELVKTEEGTKNALVMPFINALGYNVFDPTEVTPELVADVGTKKGEKVDYAILKDTKPIMLFECKCCGATLDRNHASQLYRYFSVTEARFGILTDGVVYQFYTDLEEPNKMDTRPFFVFDLMDFDDSDVAELKKFTKPAFELNQILTTASELKYKRQIRGYLAEQRDNPSENFIRLVLEESGVHVGRKTQAVIDEFRDIVRDAFNQFINEQLEAKFKSFMSGEVKLIQGNGKASEGADQEAAQAAPTQSDANGKLVVTTEEELEGFRIVRAILREITDVRRIAIRDAQSYCAIFFDDNNRKPIARLYFNGAKKYVGLFNEQKQEERVLIESLDNIYQYADRLKAVTRTYLE